MRFRLEIRKKNSNGDLERIAVHEGVEVYYPGFYDKEPDSMVRAYFDGKVVAEMEAFDNDPVRLFRDHVTITGKIKDDDILWVLS